MRLFSRHKRNIIYLLYKIIVPLSKRLLYSYSSRFSVNVQSYNIILMPNLKIVILYLVLYYRTPLLQSAYYGIIIGIYRGNCIHYIPQKHKMLRNLGRHADKKTMSLLLFYVGARPPLPIYVWCIIIII